MPVHRGNASLLLGPRRVGKTSVASVMAEKLQKQRRHHYVYFNFSRFSWRQSHLNSRYRTEENVSEAYNHQQKLHTVPEGAERRGQEDQHRGVLLGLFSPCEGSLSKREARRSDIRRGSCAGEAEELRLPRPAPGDNRQLSKHLSLVFTGSMPGMLMNYLNPNSKKPNFMRSAEIPTLRRWTPEEGLE